MPFPVSLSKILMLLTSFVCAISLSAQSTIQLSGKIVDADTKEPLSFAYITLSDVAMGTVSDGAGNFVLNIPPKYKDQNLVFSYVGYAKQSKPISELIKQQALLINLEVDATIIKEVVIKARKEYSPKQLLKKVMNNLEDNYAQAPVILDGYYRETIAENGAYISYADAAAQIHYAPYQEKPYKWKAYHSETQGSIQTLGSKNMYNGRTLHRGHFHMKTTNQDQAKVIDSRSSKNLSKTNMLAAVQGGPLGLFSKDYLKYKAAFFDRKSHKKFDFELGEVLLENHGYVYLLSFRSKLSKPEMEELKLKGPLRPFYKAMWNKVLQGKIYIDRDDFAVLKFESSVVPELKDYFCSYTTMNYKHFEYKLDIRYQKIGNKYYLKYLRHEDEFILKDTLSNNTTPYIAVSQFWVDKIQTQNVERFKLTETFANVQSNHLFDLPLEYNKEFWDDYSQQNPVAIIPDSIRKDMETKDVLEKQFADKHKRDDSLQAPMAMVKPTTKTLHKQKLIDDYAWLKQPKHPLDNPDIKNYLEAENAYMDNYFIPLRKAQREIFNELISRVDKEDESIPVELDGYWYQSKWSEEEEYPFYLRRKDGATSWDTLLNVNKMAAGKDYYNAGGISVSPNTELMFFYENNTGSDKYLIKFMDLKAQRYLPDSLSDVSDMVWLNDHQLLYTVQEPKTNRVYQLKLHELNRPQKEDTLLYQEDDVRFQISITKSKSKDYIYMIVGSSNTSETHFMKLNEMKKGFHLISPREKQHKYSVTDYRGNFYILSNKDNPNFDLYTCPDSAASKDQWQPFLQAKKGSILFDFVMFDDFMVLGELDQMERKLKIIEKESGKSTYLKIKEDLCLVSAGYNPKFNSDTLRYSLTSLKRPTETWNYNMRTGEQRLVKKQEVPYFVDNKWIKNKLVWAEAGDGTKVPITLLYHPFNIHKSNNYKRMYLTAYGSYGSGSESGFNAEAYSLIARGFVYAIAHVRGGGELGQAWHDGGKMMNKMNSFTDFIDCAEFLIEEGYAQKGNIVAEGGSAGGLLMGGVLNMRPDLFKMVILDVPFVDVVNTMLDESLPLTTIEYEEWGYPNNKKEFEYMLSYSPYDNVKAQDYPHMLFTTGVNDTRVGYWEPAKMVAKLRKMKTDNNLLFLKTDLYSGHGGGSGRFDHYKELAYKYALIFDIFSEDILKEAEEKAGL